MKSKEDSHIASLLQPQIQASGDGAGMARRRSPRLHPQIEVSEGGAGVTCRRSPRFHPQIERSEDGAGVTRRIRRRRGPSPASLPDDDDMLREILIRLPTKPSSLPRASAVCKRWRGLITDPRFLRQFYAHHRKPPLLGFFSRENRGRWRRILFNPILDTPDHIPPQRFNFRRCNSSDSYNLLDCRHGLVLVYNRTQRFISTEVVVCDPITSEQRRVPIPTKFESGFFNGAVVCAASDLGHLHGACHSRPFKVVLVSKRTPLACVYSSDTGIWGNFILTEASCKISGKPAVLVGNCLYWLSMGDTILEFDLGAHRLTVIRGLPTTSDILFKNRLIIKADDGVVGYAILSYPRFQMWKMNVNDHGVAMWVPWNTIEMERILKLPPRTEEVMAFLLRYDEDSDAIFLSVSGYVYMVQLKSMHSRKLHERIDTHCYHPFKSFYTPAIREGDEADMLHDP